MAMVSRRDRGKDYIVSSSWERVTGDGRTDTMKKIEKRKNYENNKEFIDKTIIRYIGGSKYGREAPAQAILIWNHKKKKRAFWYIMRRGDAGITSNPDRFRPIAESDFSLTDYVDINYGDEKHRLLKEETYGAANYSVVESIPLRKGIAYGKRISWIDRHDWTPQKIEYYDKEGKLWKRLLIDWQNKFGLGFWKKAEAENVQTGLKTYINIEDVRVNLGLRDKDFTKFDLERMIGK
jgi:hypothetical protein